MTYSTNFDHSNHQINTLFSRNIHKIIFVEQYFEIDAWWLGNLEKVDTNSQVGFQGKTFHSAKW